MEPQVVPKDQPAGEFAIFFEESLDLLCVAGFDGYFKRLNPAWTRRLGWTIDELLAKPFLDFVHPGDREATLAEVDGLTEGAKPQTIRFENRYRNRDGSYHWLQWNARPVQGDQRIYAIARDVTRQKRQEREILEIADREKARLGQDLHDGLCQTLAGIAALSSTLSRKLAATSDAEASAAAAEIAKMLSETIGDARDLARGLGPVGLAMAGLDGALESFALNVQRLFRVSCRFECDRPFRRLPDDVESHLYRIAQEAVNNAVSHSGGSQIEIRLSENADRGVLTVEDNGRGLDDRSHSDGIGMHTMTYRAGLIGATLEIRNQGGNGVAVLCHYPLDATRIG